MNNTSLSSARQFLDKEYPGNSYLFLAKTWSYLKDSYIYIFEDSLTKRVIAVSRPVNAFEWSVRS